MPVERVSVEVAWTEAGQAYAVALEVPAGATVLNAVERAVAEHGIPRPTPDAVRYAIFGRPCDPHALLREGDRVEILRVLPHDPKAVRRRRAAAARGAGQR